MKWRFQWIYRFGLAVLLSVAFWSVWASAQPVTDTNAPAVMKINALEKALSRLDQYDKVTFGLDRVAFLDEHAFLGEPLWKYAAFLIFILLAFYISKFLDFIINSWLKRWANKTATKFDDLLLELLHGPVKVVAFVIFLHIGLNMFHWPAAAERFLKNGLYIVVACSITYVAVKLVDLLLGLWRDRTTSAQDHLFHEHLFPVVRKSLRITVVLAGILFTADNLGFKVTSLLAGLSVGGLALGLAAQDTVANLFGAVSIFLDKPFHIGDRIRVETVEGNVEAIGLRSTRVRNLDGHHVTIPNKLMGNAIITNVTRRPNLKTEMNIAIPYDTPMAKLKQAIKLLEDIYRAHPQTEDLIVSFNKFADSALNVQVVHWWKGSDAKVYFAGMQELNLKIKERFDAEGIEFAFPTQTIHVKHDPSGKVEKK